MPDRKKPIKSIGSKRAEKTPKTTYLIVCEGKKTEPIYFKEMRQHHKLSISLEILGTGRNTIDLVKEAARIYNQNKDLYDQVWCVFDKDDFTPDNFANAIAKAEAHSFHLAWSNETFELWYLLHFRYTTAYLARDRIFSELNNYILPKYEKNLTGIYKILLPNQQTAISNAERLEDIQISDGKSPSDGNPWTKVHLLIKELLSKSQ